MKHAPVHGDPSRRARRAAAYAAVELVEHGMTIGLGSGRTASFVVEALAARVSGGLRIRAVATSRRTALQATALGIEILDFASIDSLDLAIDGADEVDQKLRAIKDSGGGLLYEKAVAAAARRMICVIDSSKSVGSIGRCPVPVEALDSAVGLVSARVRALGAAVTRRTVDGVAFRSDQGNAILDCRFSEMSDPARIASGLSVIPGVLGHGLFVDEIDTLVTGRADGTVIVRDATQAGMPSPWPSTTILSVPLSVSTPTISCRA